MKNACRAVYRWKAIPSSSVGMLSFRAAGEYPVPRGWSISSSPFDWAHEPGRTANKGQAVLDLAIWG